MSFSERYAHEEETCKGCNKSHTQLAKEWEGDFPGLKASDVKRTLIDSKGKCPDCSDAYGKPEPF
jgi:RNA polymerase subunit RPABC4/transcription elongation factor Spt4